MKVCLKCGTPNEEGTAICSRCGAAMNEPVADGLSALQRLRSMDASRPATQPDHEMSAPESVPDWLELLLARYGEDTPDFAGLDRSRSAPPSTPTAEARDAAPVVETPDAAAPDLLAEIEHLKSLAVAAPEPVTEDASEMEDVVPVAGQKMPSAPVGSGDSELEAETPRAAADWLADLETTETHASSPPLGEPSPAAASATPEPVVPAGGLDWQSGPEKPAASDLLPGDALPPMSEESLDWLADLRAARASQPPLQDGEPPQPLSESAETGAPAPESYETVEPFGEADQDLSPVDQVAGVAGEPTEALEAAEVSQEWLSQLRNTKAEAESPSEPAVPTYAETPDAAASAAEPTAEALPDWLAELERASAETAVSPESAPPAEEMPDWLRELGLDATPASAASPSDEPSQASATLGPSLPLPDAPAADVPDEPEVPDWLSRLVTVTSDEPALEPAPPAVPETPPESAAPPVPEGPAVAAADTFDTIGAADLAPEEVPDWLRELEMIQAAPADAVPAVWEAPAAVGEAGDIEDEAPAWMDDLRPLRSLASVPAAESAPPTVPETAPESFAATPAADDSLAPEWLADLQSLVESPPEAAPTAPAISTGPLPPGQATPDWLRELGAETPGAAGAPGSHAEPGQLPDWLTRLKHSDVDAIPGVERIPATPETTPTEQPATEEDVIDSLRARLGVPRVPDVEGATLFRDIVNEPVAAAETAPAQRNALNTIIWALIVIAILLGIAILSLALLSRAQDLLGGPAFQRFLDTPAAGGLVASVEAFRTPVTTLPDEAVVVMGIDYSPATEAEMRPMAEMALRDVLAHRARVVTVSLGPEGAALAQQLLMRVDDTYPYGERTLNVGYLPGEIAGLRSMVALGDLPLFAAPQSACRSLAGCPGWQDVRSLDDVALMIEVADAATPVRWWLEQMSTASVAPMPMLAAVSAVAAPEVLPYYHAGAPGPGRLQGLISGVTGAAAYEIYLGRPGRAVRSIAAQSVAHLGLVVTALVGTFVGLRAQAVRD